MAKTPISYEKINCLRANFLLNRLSVIEMAKVLEIDRKMVIYYYAKFQELRDTDPQRLFALRLRLPKVIWPTTVPRRKAELLKALPELVCNYEESVRTVGGLYRAYQRLLPDPLCIQYFTKIYQGWLKKRPVCKFVHRWQRELTPEEIAELQTWKKSLNLLKWQRAVLVLGSRQNRSVNDMAAQLEITLNTALHWLQRFEQDGLEFIKPQRRDLKPQKTSRKDAKKELLVRLLHETPKSHGYNRTAWNCQLLADTLLKLYGLQISDSTISAYIREAGFAFKKARTVLTSPDPDFRAKVEHIKQTLAKLQPDEKFFSIDEYGPKAVKPKGGIRIVPRQEQPRVAKALNGHGCIIMIAAIELSTNQVSHFYTQKKNTTEIIRMIEYLIEQYKDQRKLYLSWDAVRTHSSRQLLDYLAEINDPAFRALSRTPEIELVPLPVTAQFLNVIESIYSGMSRAVIHNSDYQSLEEAQAAIDRYFNERNAHFKANPQRAGGKLWGKEVVSAEFKDTNHCKRASDN